MSDRVELATALARAEEKLHEANNALAKAKHAAEPFDRRRSAAYSDVAEAKDNVQAATEALRASLPVFVEDEGHSV